MQGGTILFVENTALIKRVSVGGFAVVHKQLSRKIGRISGPADAKPGVARMARRVALRRVDFGGASD
ncbi:hypothetical protein [Anaerobaca lacustris]|uniref:Uncharacterized protein n=1 Tax=Anaerobaca lacustris TaxID=3044600 RepID=A0AAW6TX35_9BACT|nr:hypothetical protein [Sedimentisphaerales bacterium M17dextr]